MQYLELNSPEGYFITVILQNVRWHKKIMGICRVGSNRNIQG
jgi:hypothetical protein